MCPAMLLAAEITTQTPIEALSSWVIPTLEVAWKLATIAAAVFAGVALLVNLHDRRARSRPILFMEGGPAHYDATKRISSLHLTNVGAGPAVGVRIEYYGISAEYALLDHVTDEDHPEYEPFPELSIRPFILDFVGASSDLAGSLFSPDLGAQIWQRLIAYLREVDYAAELAGHYSGLESDLIGNQDEEIIDVRFHFRMRSSIVVTFYDGAEAAKYSRRGYIELEGQVRHRTFTDNPINYSLEQPTSAFEGNLVVLGNLK